MYSAGRVKSIKNGPTCRGVLSVDEIHCKCTEKRKQSGQCQDSYLHVTNRAEVKFKLMHRGR